jgi:palmitoyltransferase
MFQLAHLFLLTVINAFVWFALVILLVRNLYALAVNTTTIEGWEIERHETLLRRARVFGGVLEAPDGTSVPIRRQEFPYDVGIWVNVVQGMGTWNPVQWLNPLAGTPVVWRKVTYPTNGFSDRPWPPPDPDRAFYRGVKLKGTGEREGEGFTYRDEGLSNQETVEAFRRRQAEDEVRRRKPFVQRLEEQQRRSQSGTGQQEAWNGYAEDYGYENFDEVEEAARANEKRLVKDGPEGEEGEESWRNAEGERLHDFGVDEDVEFYDEGVEDADDDVPLSELLARKRAAAATAGAR